MVSKGLIPFEVRQVTLFHESTHHPSAWRHQSLPRKFSHTNAQGPVSRGILLLQICRAHFFSIMHFGCEGKMNIECVHACKVASVVSDSLRLHGL